MLTKKQIEEIREHLERAQNPLFLYDNDADGLCSFLLLRRWLGRGKGFAVRSYPDLNEQYVKKVEEYKADYVFILDKPIVSNVFFEELDKLGIQVVWIDHHKTEEKIGKFDNLFIYNSAMKGESKPTTAMCYDVTNRKEDLWIALVGCIADHHIPEFSNEFQKMYPNLWKKGIKKPFDAYYGAEIGKVVQALNFGLKDSVSNTLALQNFLLECKSPEDVLSEVPENEKFRNTYGKIKKRYDVLIQEAKKQIGDEMIFFYYGGDTSMSSDLSNELSYLYPKHIICIVFIKGDLANISLRGKNVKKILEDILPEIEGSRGGGHPNAVGARIKNSQIELFKKMLLEKINGRN